MKQFTLLDLLESDSFIRWTQGTATQEEALFWDQWLLAEPENRPLVREAQEIVAGFRIRPVEWVSTDVAYDHLERRLNREKLPVIPRSGTRGHQHLLWIWRAVAALLLVMTSGAILSGHHQKIPDEVQTGQVQTEVKTGYGEQKSVILSDGSEIILNGNTSLLYTSDLATAKAVDMHLEGEAYFSIVGGKGKREVPFRVHTKDGVIKILGTRLSVSTRDEQTRVVLEKGNIVVSNERSEELQVVPGELVEFSSGSKMKIREVDTEQHTAWIYGRLQFEKETLAEVLRRIEHIYGVEAVISDTVAGEQRISGSVESFDLEIITSALTEMFSIPIYMADNNRVIVAGVLQDEF